MSARRFTSGVVALLVAFGVGGCSMLMNSLTEKEAQAWEEAIWEVAPDNLVAVHSRVRTEGVGATSGDITLVFASAEVDTESMIGMISAAVGVTPDRHHEALIDFVAITGGSSSPDGGDVGILRMDGIISDRYAGRDSALVRVNQWNPDEAWPDPVVADDADGEADA